jgi:hypothetical protein
MKKRPRTLGQMEPLIKEWQKTGMNKKLFCRTHKINVHTFSYWVDKLDKLGTGSKENTKESTEKPLKQAPKPAATVGNGFVQLESGERHKSDKPMSVPSLELEFPKGVKLRLIGVLSDWELSAVKSLLY